MIGCVYYGKYIHTCIHNCVVKHLCVRQGVEHASFLLLLPIDLDEKAMRQGVELCNIMMAAQVCVHIQMQRSYVMSDDQENFRLVILLCLNSTPRSHLTPLTHSLTHSETQCTFIESSW